MFLIFGCLYTSCIFIALVKKQEKKKRNVYKKVVEGEY